MGLATQQHTPSGFAYCSQETQPHRSEELSVSLLSVPIRGVCVKGNLWFLMGVWEATQVGGAWNYPANHNTKEHLTTLNSLINSTGILHLKSIFNFIISSRGNVELKLLYPFALIAYLDNMNVNWCIKSIKSSNSTRFRWKGVFLGVAIFIHNIKYSSGS